jgi:hypothetical protein
LGYNVTIKLTDTDMAERHKVLIEEFFPEVSKIRDNQKTQMEKMIVDNRKLNDVVLLYFSTQTNSSWEDIFFSLRLLEYKEIKHFALPIRGVFNKVIKLLYLTHQSEEKREELCRKDFLKMASLFYTISVKEEEKAIYLKSFNDYNTLDIKIDDKITAFPDMKAMLTKVFPNEVETQYFFYSDLSEYVHGNVLFNFRKNNYYPTGLDLIGRFSFELIRVNDWHLNNGKPSEEILTFLKKWNKRFTSLT